jgi:hypothetical protein
MSDNVNIKEAWNVWTLVDVTGTGITNGNTKERNQQRNFETLVQTISMLTQPWSIMTPHMYNMPPTRPVMVKEWSQFGEVHRFNAELLTPKLNIWHWRFAIEAEYVLGENGERIIDMCNDIPIIQGLNENAVLDPPVFSNKDHDRNILFIKDGGP